MNKRELCVSIAEQLMATNTRKPVQAERQIFHISDDHGNSKDFIVRRTERSLGYTVTDVQNVVEACVEVIQDAIRRGETVSISGFGTFGIKYRKAHKTKIPNTETWVEIDGHYVPKFAFGQNLKACTQVYEANLKDQQNMHANHPYDESKDPSVVESAGE